jgi:glycine cleavage system aminomethyltransferase T
VSSVEEHLATRSHAGLFDFSFMGLYEFPDGNHLRGLQTRRLEHLADGRIAYTLILNPDGSVFNDATVWRLADGRFWLFTGRRSDFSRFKDHARERSGEFAILALQGPASGRVMARLIGDDAVRDLRYFHFLQTENLIIGRLGYSGELGYELLVPAGETAGLRAKVLENGDVRECGWEAANSLRIEAGYVLFDREIDGRANPRELGLERLVELPAQRFGATRMLVGLDILEGATGDTPPAQVTSECVSPTLGKTIALGYARPGARAGDLVRLADHRAARVASLPFYDPERRRPRDNPL